ncbi:MAG: hypothetical protein APF84_19600 [Gracilibacter sp. BRH_c7a]|nr:MAG: hypothetical protein APF84_19600 [Gracilibacter sp. BRH_c7a]
MDNNLSLLNKDYLQLSHEDNCNCIFCQQQIQGVERFLCLATDIFCLIDLKGRIQWINAAMEKSLGYSPEEMKNMDFFSLIHPDDRVDALGVIDQVAKDHLSLPIEVRLSLKNEIYRYYEWYVYLDSHNQLYYSVARDISTSKEYEEKLLRLNTIVESSLDAIYAIDQDGRIMSWNNAAEQIFGYSKEEIIGQSINLLAFPEQKDEMDNIIRIIRNGETYSYESIRHRKTGEVVVVFITLAPIKDSVGRVIGTSAVARDITAHQKFEKEIAHLDKLNTIAELASVISHEVRNPMTTVKGFLQLLYNKINDKTFKEYFEIMIEEMERVNSILQEFNNIGKHKESQRTRHDLNHIIKSMTPLLEADAIHQGKMIKFDLKEVPNLIIDANEIRQLILNLTRNALESMEQNGRVIVGTYFDDKKAILSVQDQGEGIASENLEKLGTPFFSTKEEGTGLGLYVCFEIAQRNNARINVDTSHQGTTISVEFEDIFHD